MREKLKVLGIGWIRSRCCISVLYGSQKPPGTREAQVEGS
jgi:hypothetical protein